MGSIRKRLDNGLLYFDFRYKGVRCREQTALEDTGANRKRLEKVLARIDADIEACTFEYRQYFPSSKKAHQFDAPPLAPSPASTLGDVFQHPESLPETPIFKDFAETWFLEKEVEWRKSHLATTRLDMDNLLIPQFGDKMVSAISKADILAFRAALGKTNARGKESRLSAPRINKIMGPLRQILNEAADRFGFSSPFVNVKQLRIKRTDIHPFTLDEVKAIIKSVRPDYKNYYTVRFFTGMRTGEVNGLQWKYVDFEKRLILVRETFVLGEDEYTKTDGSQRDIQMSQIVYDALKAQEKATSHLSKYVFCNAKAAPLDNKNVTNRVWYPLLRHLGIQKRVPYQCRHTAATLWLAAGENPEWIARQMGHTTTEMLFRIYSRYIPNLTRKDGSAFERLLLQSEVTDPSAGYKATNDYGSTEAANEQSV